MHKKLFQYTLLFLAFLGFWISPAAFGADTTESQQKQAQLRLILRHYEDQLKTDPHNVKLIMAIAEAYSTFKDYPEAIEYYQRALAIEPGNSKIKNLLAQSYLANNDLTNSQQIFNELIQANPRNVDVLGGLGRIESLKHHPSEAESYYQKALNIDPSDFTVLYYLGELRIEQKRFQQAQDILENLMERDPEATWVVQALERAKQGPVLESIRKLVEEGNYQAAMLQYKKELAKNPKNTELYIEFGRVYSLMHDYKAAIKIYKEGLNVQPDSNGLRLNLGYAYIADKNLKAAQKVLETVLRTGTDNADALAGLGRIAVLEGDLTKGEKDYQSALEANPNSTLALSFFADLRRQEKKFTEAQSIYERILQVDPTAVWVKPILQEIKLAPVLEAIKQKVNQGRYKEAENLYNQLIAIAPDNVDNYIRFAQFYIDQKDYDKATSIFKEGIEANPGNMKLFVGLGYAYLSSMNFVNSLKTFNYVLERDPTNFEAIAGLGRINAAIGNLEGASYFYQWALSLNPNDIASLSYLADLRLEQKKYSEAQKLFSKIIHLDPTASWAKQSMFLAQFAPNFEEIKALEKSGDIKEAIMKYRQLLTLAPDNPEIYYELGRLYLKMKRYGEALDVYQEGLKNNPTANELRVGLGLAYLSVNNLIKAKQNLQAAFIKDPKNVEAVAGLGRIAALSGDISDAKNLYEVAYDLNPNDTLTLSYFAEFWMQQKEYSKALRLYERLAKLDPKAAWVRQSLENAKNAPLLQEISGKERGKSYKEVEELFHKLIAESPDNPDYYVKLGQFYIRLKRYQDAIVTYLQGLQVQPNSIELQVALGFAYLEKGDTDIAKKMFDMVLKREHDNGDALAGLGKLAETEGNDAQAEKLYAYAVKNDPDNITALTYYAEFMSKQMRYEDAEKLFRQVLRVDPSADWVKLSIEDAKHGAILAEIRKKDAAKDYQGEEILWQQLLIEAPKVPEYYLRMGLFYHRIKQYDKAIATYEKGISLAPKDAEIYAALGLVYLSKKEPKNARRVFQKALKLDPLNTDALAGMGYVYYMENVFPKSEEYILAALNIDPNNVAALSSLGDLMYKEKRYPEAVKAYQRLRELRPKEKWIKTSLENAMNGPELDRLTALVKDEKFEQAAAGYRELLKRAPDNPYYYFGLGLMYVRLKEFGAAIQTYLEGLKANPEENELLVSLGYAYFFNKDLGNARQVLEKAIERDAKNPEALAGMGRVNAIEENFDEAEYYYRMALSYDPKNQSALSFYGDLLLKQKRYSEAQAIFTWLQTILPDSPWVSRAIQDAADGPVSDLARTYANREEFELAAELYSNLVAEAPDDPARYQPLGQMYVNLQQYCCAIKIYLRGLMFDPDALYLWRSIAFAYIQMGDYNTARCILLYLLEKDPEDAESWAGLGRIEALDGSICCAEQYYACALELSPYNITALSFLAALREDEQYNFSALDIYETLMMLEPEPKWVRVGLNTALNLTQPTLLLEGAYHAEDQWDPTVHRWSAQYEVYGGRAFLNYPVCDDMTLWASCGEQFYVLKDLLLKTTIYSFDVQHVAFGERWVLSPCLYLDARAGFTVYSPYHDGTFCMQHGTIAEPMLTLTYHQPTEKAVLSFSSDSDLVARNFNTRVARMVGRYWIAGSYEREVVSKGWLGLEADAFWYTDFVHNSSQRVLGWFQWRPPYYSDNILFRYQCKYQTFRKNIPDYYTYKPQIINQLQVTLQKSWRVCWADSFYTSLSYGYGWQDTHTRYAQIIVIAPPLGTPPYVWDRRRFNIVFGNIIYDRGRLQLNLAGDYYRDTEKYTMWSLIAGVRWRF